MLKISYAGCLNLYLAILVKFTLKMCVATQNHEKFTKTSKFWEFKVTDVDKIKKSVTNASYDKQHICTYLQPILH